MNLVAEIFNFMICNQKMQKEYIFLCIFLKFYVQKKSYLQNSYDFVE